MVQAVREIHFLFLFFIFYYKTAAEVPAGAYSVINICCISPDGDGGGS